MSSPILQFFKELFWWKYYQRFEQFNEFLLGIGLLSHVHSKINLEWLNLGYSRRNFYNSFFYFTRTEEIAKVLTNWRHKFHLKTMTSVTMQTFLCMCLYKFEIYEQTFLIIRSNRTKRRWDKKQSEMYWVLGNFGVNEE